MKDAKDTSKYAVLDKVYVEHSEGVATLYANVVTFDGTVTKRVVVKDFTLNKIFDKEDWNDDFASLADFVNFRFPFTDGLNFHEFDPSTTRSARFLSIPRMSTR